MFEDCPEHKTLKENLRKALELLKKKQSVYDEIADKLVIAEDAIVEAKELIRKEVEALRLFEATKLHPIVDQDLRVADIKRFKEELPRLMKQIEHEAPLEKKK